MMNDIGISIFADEGAAGNSGARFYDGKTWTAVVPEEKAPVEPPKTKKNPLSFFRRSPSSSSSNKDKTPVPPVLDGDGNILVTIPSFRDGLRCGHALFELFKNAKHPDNVVVSLVEQEHEDDSYCLEYYCFLVAELRVLVRTEIHPGAFNIRSNEAEMNLCPRINQIRVMRVQDTFAKGPPWSRALGRRSLGNEEFCLQTVAYSTFVEKWDEKIRKEWLLANNEFGIISNPPKPKLAAKSQEVPRTCRVEFLEEEKLPHYDSHTDGKVEKLKKPLLAHTWSPGFSFSKCHLEESAPSDGFLQYVSSDIEAFARYARLWTRGYDVYTPTQNIVYRQSGVPNIHRLEWINKWAGRKTIILNKSLRRIRSYLEILVEGDREEGGGVEKVDNLGIYGIGKRRTLKQLNEFVGIDLNAQQSRPEDLPCGNFQWVPYNSEISPMDNLYSNPDDLDPQPEYPMRTELTFANDYETSIMNLDVFDENLLQPSSLRKDSDTTASPPSQSRDAPYGTLFILWILGLVLWCYVHVFSATITSGPKRRKKIGKNSSKNK